MKRRPSAELLDSDCGTAEEVAASLLDLQSLNRWFGGVSTGRALIEQVARGARRNAFSLLEVAAGDGYVPRLLAAEFEKSGIRLEVTLLDRAASHLPKNGVSRKLAGDAFRLPFPDSSVDLVSSSLFIHHLAPDQAAAFAAESLRVCRVAALAHDLIRHPLHLTLAYAAVPFYRSRITRNDAPASVRQAYTVEEMRRFFEQSGAARVDAQRRFLFRMGVIAWKPLSSRTEFASSAPYDQF